MNKFNKIILGGTFDHLHIGHKKLIDKAFELGEDIAIGIATEKKLFKNKILSQEIEDFQTRKNSVMAYLKEKNYIDISKLIELNDIFGTAKTEKNIDAIIVTKETKKNAEKINKWRKENGFSEIKIIEVDMIRGNDNQIVSSERIRLGEIDREGASYLNLFKNDLILPESLKEELRRPMGQIFKSTKELVRYIDLPAACLPAGRARQGISDNLLIAVGDVVAGELIKNGFEPDIKVIDFKTRREKADSQWLIANGSKYEIYANMAGTINTRAVGQLNKIIKEIISRDKSRLVRTLIINGEEDLLALPAILLAPLNSIVVYGQYGVGVVVIKINEKIKEKVKKLIEKFD